jgi:hypothetical protein
MVELGVTLGELSGHLPDSVVLVLPSPGERRFGYCRDRHRHAPLPAASELDSLTSCH